MSYRKLKLDNGVSVTICDVIDENGYEYKEAKCMITMGFFEYASTFEVDKNIPVDTLFSVSETFLKSVEKDNLDMAKKTKRNNTEGV